MMESPTVITAGEEVGLTRGFRRQIAEDARRAERRAAGEAKERQRELGEDDAE